MHRTQVSLEDWQYDSLKSLANRNGQSLSDLVREILAKHLRGSQRSALEKLSAIDGIFDDPGASGRDHDKFLYGENRRTR